MTKTDIGRVMVFGSSISMISRPTSTGVPYPRALERRLNASDSTRLWIVENLSSVAGIIEDFPQMAERVVQQQPEVVILNYGYVEALRRPHSRRLWFWTHLYVPGQHPIRSRARILGRYWTGIRRRIGWHQPWVSQTRFQRLLVESLAYILKESGATVILLELNPFSQKLENYFPNSGPRIAEYNQCLHKTVEYPRVQMLRWAEVMLGVEHEDWVDDMMPDGTHFDGRSHGKIADALTCRILSIVESAESRSSFNLHEAHREVGA